MRKQDNYEIAKLWLPDEIKGVIKITAFTDGAGHVSFDFNDEYALHITKESLLNFECLIKESIDALETFEEFNKFERIQTKSWVENLDNVLEFKKRNDT